MTTAPKQPPADNTSDVIERVEVQRMQLRRAISVMACARFALAYEDWIEDESGLDCADLVAVACELVQQVMTALDRVSLQPLSAASRPRRSSRDGTQARKRAIRADVSAGESIQTDSSAPGTSASSQ